MAFECTKEYIEDIKSLISNKQSAHLTSKLKILHFADLAELMNQLLAIESVYLIKILDTHKTSEALAELNEDTREQILQKLSAKEIAEELEELDTDDAADIVNELSDEKAKRVIDQIEDEDHVEHIIELLSYEENTAGAFMAKELVMVNENWGVPQCLQEIRNQAKNITRVHSIYVVDDKGILKGRLSLKDLMISPSSYNISQVYIPKVDYVTVATEVEDVARLMQKYDLEAIPVVGNQLELLGRITIDDIVDFIKEEADKDYQLAAGISKDVEADDSILELTKARLPWLVLGLFGGLCSVYIMKGFEHALEQFPVLFFFTPLIAAMAGNVGVQSSAIIVQGLANGHLKGSAWSRLLKEVGLSLINGLTLGILVILFGFIVGQNHWVSLTIAISLLLVNIVASLVGTFIPIILHKRGIDPAIATGPFITTSNDIFGIFLFFHISKWILGF